MKRVSIAPQNWSRQLDELSHKYDGWLVSLDIQMPSKPARTEFRRLPLVGITAERNNSGTISIAVAEVTGEHLTHTIHSPTRVFVEQTKQGASAALEIDSADGVKAVLQFRSHDGK